MRQHLFPRLLPFLLSGVLCLSTACACRAEGTPDAVAAAGVHFDDEDIASALRMLETGEADNAIGHLKHVLDDPNAPHHADRDPELRAAMAIVYARSSQAPKAVAILRPLTSGPGTPAQRARAQVLLSAVTGAFKEGTPQTKNLAPRSEWYDALRAVKADLQTRLKASDAKITDAVNNKQWAALSPAVDASADLVAQVNAIEVDPAGSASAISAHKTSLTTLSGELGKSITEHKSNVARLQNERNHSKGGNNRQTRVELTDELKTENDLIDAMQAAEAKIDEARSAAEQPPAKRRGKKP